MSMSINGSGLLGSIPGYMEADSVKNSSKTQELESKLSSGGLKDATDEELMEACKSFETYFVEQVFKEMKKTVHSSDDENDYMQYFGDTMTEQYAQTITDSGQLGIAQMLYESMKR